MMGRTQAMAFLAIYFGLATVSAQMVDFNMIAAAPTVANGPTGNGAVTQAASLITTFATPSAVLTAGPTQTLQVRDLDLEKRDQTVSTSVSNSAYGASVGQVGQKMTLNYGSLYWFSGGCTHNIYGNIDNSGLLELSQTSYLQSNKYASGLQSSWVGHDPLNGNLVNRVGGTIQLDDINSGSGANYNWQLRSFINNGTLQMCGRGDTGGSSFQIYSDADMVNNGFVSYEQVNNNQGSANVWRNTQQSCSGTSNVYNNGAFRLINTVLVNSQNVLGNGCFQVGQGGVFWLASGTYTNQNAGGKSPLSGQSVTFTSSSGTLHMETGVYSSNSNFGAQVYGFSTGNSLEFSEWIRSYSYSSSTGILTVYMWLGNKVNIAIGTGYSPASFIAKTPWLSYNAILYNGAAPSQSAPAVCSITAPICGNLGQSPPVPSATGYVTTTTTATPGSPQTTISVTPSGTVSGTVIIVTAKPSVWNSYINYYPALATGLTTDPALAATSTTTAGQPCPTTPEAGTACGFLNPEDPCSPQPNGYGPVPTPDTPAAFMSYPVFQNYSSSAPTVVPSTNGAQYNEVFSGLNGSVSGQSYLTLVTLQTYDVAACARACDTYSIAPCTAFNIFVQRDPSLRPSTNTSAQDLSEPTIWGYQCPNPPSMTTIGCTLWGSSIDASLATNTGGSGGALEGFTVVITASNGYDKTNSTTPVISSSASSSVSTTTATGVATSSAPSTLVTMTSTSSAPATTSTTPALQGGGCYNPQPKPCGQGAISAPSHWLGSQYFPGPYNPDLCRRYAQSQNWVNQNAALQQGIQTYSTCQMFNAYYLNKNGAPAGTVCSLYDAVLDSSYATNYGGKDNSGNSYQCKQSWMWSLQ